MKGALCQEQSETRHLEIRPLKSFSGKKVRRESTPALLPCISDSVAKNRCDRPSQASQTHGKTQACVDIHASSVKKLYNGCDSSRARVRRGLIAWRSDAAAAAV
jgi:hypothetical protein